VRLYEKMAKTRREATAPVQPAIELAQLSPRSALIVVDPRAIRNAPGMSVVPVASGRAFLAFDEGRGLADLELALLERLRNSRISAAARKDLRLLQRQVRDWRRGRGYRFSKRSIILVERAPRSRGAR
jgi:hypothetical protein